MTFGKTLEYILSGLLLVAIISVLVSQNSTTPSAIQALGAAITNIFAAIVAPITTGAAASSASNAANGATIAAQTGAATNSSQVGTATAAGVTNLGPGGFPISGIGAGIDIGPLELNF